MITEAVLSVFFGLMEGIAGLLPEAGSLGMQEFSGIWYGYSWLNSFLPLSELLIAVGLLLGFHAALYAFLMLRIIRGWLPFV